MMHIINKLFFLLLILISSQSFSQKAKSYLILTYVVNDYTHEVKNYYWIIPDDSIDNVKSNYKKHPLYLLDDLTSDKLTDCKEGKTIDVHTHTTKTEFDLDSTYVSEVKSLEMILKNNKVLVQKIAKKWGKKDKEKIKIYVTPVVGIFMFCEMNYEMKKRYNCTEKIVLPISDFKVDLEYMNTEKVKEFLYGADFSLFSYYNRL